MMSYLDESPAKYVPGAACAALRRGAYFSEGTRPTALVTNDRRISSLPGLRVLQLSDYIIDC